MDAALLIGFYVAVALLIIRVRRASLAVAALVLSGMLALALIAQATISSRLAGYAALGLVIAVVMIALAVQLGAWVTEDDGPEGERMVDPCEAAGFRHKGKLRTRKPSGCPAER
jgi:hypothetical protein